MLIYNTLTKKKEEFKPINPPNVTMYMCGPTIYDFFHIGNGRTFVMADIIRRYLEYKNYDVKYVMNLTDVDDKLITKANEENSSLEKVGEKFAGAFFEDIQKLGILKANVYPKATEHMTDIIDMIKSLEEKEYAYNVDGNVFFDVNKFDGYGKLSGKVIEDLVVGDRTVVNDQKRNPVDFTLWKKAKPEEPSWESPWGKGRPGWHIECSAMSSKHLGNTIDIHGGGTDLIFPHHENEIAQSEASHGSDFVKYWIHFGFLNIDETKMSKSLGNFFTARDVLKKYSANTIRIFFSQTHYAGQLNFSAELLDAAEKGLEKITNLAQRINSITPSIEKGLNTFENERYLFAFESAMDDNFNTPQAIAAIFDFTRDFNKFLSKNEKLPLEVFENAKEFLKSTLTDVLGIEVFKKENSEDSKESFLMEVLISLRDEAKKNRNYELADDIRNKLKDVGVVLEDSKDGTTYKYSK